MFELLDCFQQLAFVTFPLPQLPGIRFRMERVGGELGLPPLKLGFERAEATVQIPPTGVCHGAVGPRNFLRAIFAQLNFLPNPA
jgi:hypothetical protein